jgi:predicted HTH domain antitoxin
MTTVTIDLPESVFSALRRAPDELVQEMRIEAAAQWYAQRRISQEKAAEIAGLPRAAFIDELARRRIPVIQASLEESLEEARRED